MPQGEFAQIAPEVGISAQQHQSTAVQLAQGYNRSLHQRVIHPQQHALFLDEQAAVGERVAFRWPAEDKVKVALGEPLLQLILVTLLDLQFQRRQLAVQLAQGIGDGTGGRGRDQAESQYADFAPGGLAHLSAESLGSAEDGLRFGQQGPSGGGEAAHSIGAFEEARAEGAFQLLDMGGQGRLRHIQAAGGAGKMPFLRHGHERSQPTQFRNHAVIVIVICDDRNQNVRFFRSRYGSHASGMRTPHVLIMVANPAISTTLGEPVGFWAAELIHPYDTLTRAGWRATIASPEGGRVELDRYSDPRDASGYSREDTLSRDYLERPEFVARLERTPALASLDPSDFDALIVAGGQSPMFTFRSHRPLQELFLAFHASGKPSAALCHGTCLLLELRRPDGSPWLRGRRLTGFSNPEEDVVDQAVGRKVMPFRIEDEARKLGADFVAGPAFQPFAVRDGNLITGQQQHSGHEVARLVLQHGKETR